MVMPCARHLPPAPLPCHPAGLCLTACARPWKKLTAYFCLAARQLQLLAGRGEVGRHHLLGMDFSASVLVGRAGTGHGRLLRE